MISLAAKDALVRQRIAVQVSVAAEIQTAGAIDEELLSRRIQVPGVFTCLLRRASPAHKTPGLPTQIQMLEVHIGIVTDGRPQSSGALDGPKGSYAVREAMSKALHWWKLEGAAGRLEFAEEEKVGSAGGRELWEQVYVTMIQEAFS